MIYIRGYSFLLKNHITYVCMSLLSDCRPLPFCTEDSDIGGINPRSLQG